MHAIPTCFKLEITTGIVIYLEEVSEDVCLSHCFLTGYLPIQKQLLEIHMSLAAFLSCAACSVNVVCLLIISRIQRYMPLRLGSSESSISNSIPILKTQEDEFCKTTLLSACSLQCCLMFLPAVSAHLGIAHRLHEHLRLGFSANQDDQCHRESGAWPLQ